MNINHIIKSIEKKKIQNKKFYKEYKIDLYNQKVIKYKKNSNSLFEYQCINFLCEYYQKYLNLDFKVTYLEDMSCLVTESPFLTTANELRIRSNKNLATNTLNILKDFSKTEPFLNKIKKDNAYTIKIFCDSYTARNYFIINKESYLLDLESFYFCVYDENNKSLGKAGIKEEYLNIIKDFDYPKEHGNGIIQKNMLIY